MTQPIDSNSTPDRPKRVSPKRVSVEQYYQQAVAAFKAQNYGQALVYFQRLGQLPPESPYHLKAAMGQVRALQRLGQIDEARALCQQMLLSGSPQMSQWASQVLSQLPPAEREGPTLDQSTDAVTGTDLIGFVPLDAPLDRGINQPLNPLNPSSPRPDTPAAIPVDQPAADEGDASPLGSLFHFQQLNQRLGEDSQDQPLPPAAVDPVEPDRAGGAGATGPKRVKPAASAAARQQVPLPQRPWGLWAGQGLTAIALLWVLNWAFHAALRAIDGGLRWVRWPIRLGLPGANQTYTVWLVSVLVLLALASPWILDYVLAFWHGQKPLSSRQLQTSHPETLRLLRQVCRQQGWQLPELRLIADPAPLCFSYGWLPRNTRIVVSQGLLDQCSSEALTALYGYELARAVNRSLPVLSAAGLLLLLLHKGYQGLAQVGDGIAQPLVRNVLGLLSSAIYGLFWLLRQLLLWLSRLCSSWGDSRAVALTQHPDHLSEGLVGFAEAIATYLRQRGHLHPLHTSLEILMPVGYRQALSPGSLLGSAEQAGAIETNLMAIDSLNPYRQWLRVNAAHTPLGERLFWLNQQALLRNQPGIGLDAWPLPAKVSLPILFLQKAPLAGLVIGGSLAMGLWFVGGVVNRLGWWRLSWFYQDPSILAGGLWLGLGLGLMVRINQLFPDRPTGTKSTKTQATPIAALLKTPSPLPVRGQPVTLRGNLRGQPGMANWGLQDLYLEDDSGLVRLANPVPLGSLQGALQPHHHPFKWIGRRVTVTGWGRYSGGMPWVDIDQIQIDPKRAFQAYGPIWATLFSLGCSLLGIWTILRGG